MENGNDDAVDAVIEATGEGDRPSWLEGAGAFLLWLCFALRSTEAEVEELRRRREDPNRREDFATPGRGQEAMGAGLVILVLLACLVLAWAFVMVRALPALLLLPALLVGQHLWRRSHRRTALPLEGSVAEAFRRLRLDLGLPGRLLVGLVLFLGLFAVMGSSLSWVEGRRRTAASELRPSVPGAPASVEGEHFEKGTLVLARWKGKDWFFLALVLGETDGRVELLYYDGERESLPWSELRRVELEVGLPVQAVWPDDGRWYPGRIDELGQGRVHVLFDDGDRAWVPYGKIRVPLR